MHYDNAGRFLGGEALPETETSRYVAARDAAWAAVTVRSRLIWHGTRLAKRAAELCDPTWRLPYTPALALPSWLPSHPVGQGQLQFGLTIFFDKLTSPKR
jgi:hypothetical protein